MRVYTTFFVNITPALNQHFCILFNIIFENYSPIHSIKIISFVNNSTGAVRRLKEKYLGKTKKLYIW